MGVSAQQPQVPSGAALPMLGPNTRGVTQPCVTWGGITVGHIHNSDNSLSPLRPRTTAFHQVWAIPGLLSLVQELSCC